jgi:hypothetical protein
MLLWSRSLLVLPPRPAGGRREAARAAVSAFAVVAFIRLGLTFSSFEWLRSRLLGASEPPRYFDLTVVRRTAWSVLAASRFVPFASCLTQALAGQVLLARQGVHSEIRLGVRQGQRGSLMAHAWLVCDDLVVLGGEDGAAGQFSPIAHFGPIRR